MSSDAVFTAARSRPAPSLHAQPAVLPSSYRALLVPGHPESAAGPSGDPGAQLLSNGGVSRRLLAPPSQGAGVALHFPPHPSGMRDDELTSDTARRAGYPGWHRAVLERDVDISVDWSLLPQPADEAEMLPSAVHPSYPTGHPYRRPRPYISAPKLPSLLHSNLALLGPTIGPAKGSKAQTESGEGSEAALARPLKGLAPHVLLRAATDTAASPPHWPFCRFGPGPGGASALQRHAARHPHRPTRDVWADLGLSEILPLGVEQDPLKMGIAEAHEELPMAMNEHGEEEEIDDEGLLGQIGMTQADKLAAELEGLAARSRPPGDETLADWAAALPLLHERRRWGVKAE